MVSTLAVLVVLALSTRSLAASLPQAHSDEGEFVRLASLPGQDIWLGKDNPREVLLDPDYIHGPSGPDLIDVPRLHVGKVPYGGEGIYTCINPNEVAITFDDGPSEWTNYIREQFQDYNFTATFFMTGYNFGRKINNFDTNYPKLIQRMHDEGHQIGHHSWRHRNLDKEITSKERIEEMLANEKALREVLGIIPTYMRPPFAVCKNECARDMAKLGYHISMFDVDPQDYKFNAKNKINNAINLFDGDLAKGGSVVLCHDIKEWTAKGLVPHMLKALRSKGLKGVTLGQCLNDPKENWYRQVGGKKAYPTNGTTRGWN